MLSQFAHVSPANLKQRVGNARTYIRPVQKSLDTSAIFQLPSGVCCSVSVMLSISGTA